MEFDYGQELQDDEEALVVLPLSLLGVENDKKFLKVEKFDPKRYIVLKVLDTANNLTNNFVQIEINEEDCQEGKISYENIDVIKENTWNIHDIVSSELAKMKDRERMALEKSLSNIGKKKSKKIKAEFQKQPKPSSNQLLEKISNERSEEILNESPLPLIQEQTNSPSEQNLRNTDESRSEAAMKTPDELDNKIIEIEKEEKEKVGNEAPEQRDKTQENEGEEEDEEEEDEEEEKEDSVNDREVIFGRVTLVQISSKSSCLIQISFNSKEAPVSIDHTSFSVKAKQKKLEFKSRIFNKFMPKEHLTNLPEDEQLRNYNFLASAVSNLIGGIAYYKGTLQTTNTLIIPSVKREVFTTTPSRKVFPRGFLWDEGFHEILLCKMNVNLCVEVMTSWFTLIDVQGWVAREQVRGAEITERVPPNFQMQDGKEANPPTLVMAVENIVKAIYKANESKICGEFREKGQGPNVCVGFNDDKDLAGLKEGTDDRTRLDKFLKFAFGKMKLWFAWITHTQAFFLKENKSNDIPRTSFNFRWHCKGDCFEAYYLGSGLDDYPRNYKSFVSLKHLDLHCWMISFARSLDFFEGFIYEKVLKKKTARTHRPYLLIFEPLNKTLFEEFLDSSDNLFKDVLYENKDGEVKREFSNSLGYINVFPLIIGLIPKDSLMLEAVLNLLSDPNKLWSKYGIRSLSISDHFYGRGDNYWTGPIWIPLNFLILRGLKLYYFDHHRARNLYEALRENLLKNVQSVWNSTGYLWEVYNPENGAGERGRPFCGWSALIAVIFSDNYLLL